MISTEKDQLWIDMYAHLFNANDLPVRGFVKTVTLRKIPLLNRVFARVLARMARKAPTYGADTEALAKLIASGQPPILVPPTSWWTKFGRLGRMAGEAIRSRIDLVYELDKRCEDAGDEQPCKGDNPLTVMSLRSEIHLYVPLCVDLEPGVKDEGSAEPRDQFDFMKQLSDASLLGELPNYRSIILPMVGFDPRRADDDSRNSLPAIKALVERGEAIGIKLYPAMGFKPLGNVPPIRCCDKGAAIDSKLRELYTWCELEQVPITAHCSPANSVRGAEECARPDSWRPVLDEFSQLRLNLAHVGGIEKNDWMHEAAVLVTDSAKLGRHVYCDVGNHDLVTNGRKFFDRLRELQQDGATGCLIDRMMFGTDYWFLLMHRDSEHYLGTYAQAIRCGFKEPAAVYPRFSGITAQEFLGFHDHSNKNRIRVQERMARLVKPPGWTEPKSFTLLMTPPASTLCPQPGGRSGRS